MTFTHFILRAALVTTFALAPHALVASASGTGPKQIRSLADLPAERSGISNIETGRVDLPEDFGGGGRRTLRMRKVTIAPGGVLPMHSHQDRPSVSYVLSGTLTEFLAGDDLPHSFTAGQSNSSFRRDHALVNNGAEPVVFLEVDIPTN